MVPNEPLAPGLVADQAGPWHVWSLHDRSGERTGPPASSGARSVTPRPKRRTNRPSDDLRRLFGHSTTEPRTDAKRRGLARRLGAIRDRRPVAGSLREPALPDRRAGDRRADERAQRETPGER